MIVDKQGNMFEDRRKKERRSARSVKDENDKLERRKEDRRKESNKIPKTGFKRNK